MNPSITQQAAQNAAQGQQLLASDRANEANYQGQYNTAAGQAQQANQQVQDFTNYMRGAGSGTNLYSQGLQQAEAAQGFNPATLATATQNLTQSQNALQGLGQAAQEGVNSAGLTGAQLASRYATLTQPLQGVVASQNNAVNNLQQLYQNALTSANQSAGLGVQSEQNTLQGYQNAYQNAANVRDSALSQMQFYADLAQKQGGLNSQSAAAYAGAQQAYASAQAALAGIQQTLAQAALTRSQTAGQNLTNQQTQAAMAAAAAKTQGQAKQTAQQQAQQAANQRAQQQALYAQKLAASPGGTVYRGASF